MLKDDKILTVDVLVEKLSLHRMQGEKIVLCHGVFDLLHIGHIRHLKEAKKAGDILVVTITPDIYVNRGPHRPVFSEDLRAEAVCALDWVDYVAINRWPTAVETIKMFQPNFYVKGANSLESNKLSQETLALEEKAVVSAGGELIFTYGIGFSSSRLINHAFPVFPADVRVFLNDFSARHSFREILDYLENSASLKVLVVGEAIIDEYRYCQAIGKSSKEPTLVVKSESMEKFAGGVLAVANHVAKFCKSVGLISFLGDYESQEVFIEEKLSNNIKKDFLYKEDAPTIVKRRFVESYFFTKMFEVYDINDRPLNGKENRQLCDLLQKRLPEYDVIIALDFGHGMISDEAKSILSNSAKFLALNVQANAGNMGYHTISAYDRADFISVAENEIRLEARDRQGDLHSMILDNSEKLKCNKMTITRGKKGSLCYSADDGFYEIPAFAGQVVDRVGAGDAFFSVAALCVAQNAPMDIVGFIGNAVGAQAVATVGHRESTDREQLYKYIESLLR